MKKELRFSLALGDDLNDNMRNGKRSVFGVWFVGLKEEIE
jgi:hypothetical protein